MHRKTAFLALLAGGLFSSPALAADWSTFDSVFQLFPCNDGWSACIVKGDAVTPDLQDGDDGLARPSSLRLDWATLEPAPAFSPFARLSKYTGELAAADAGGEDTDAGGGEDTDAGGGEAPPPPAEAGSGGGDEWSSGDAGGGGSDTDAVAAAEPPDDGGGSLTRPPDAGGSDGGGSLTRPPDAGGSDGGGSLTRPPDAGGSDAGTASLTRPPDAGGSDGGGSLTRPPDAGGSDAGSGTLTRPPDAVAAVDPGPPVPTGPETCDNLTILEPAAMMGKLSDGQVGCLEASLAAETTQTGKDKLSRILMANAWSKGDKKTWEKLVKRHLDEIDQSDPDICYKYALYLSKKGPGRATGVLRWADVALENRTRWSGDTYKSRVYNLYKLRSAAAQSLWQRAESQHASAPTDQTGSDVEKYRNMTKVNSREWFEYAREAGKDTTKALQLCISAAGTKDYCEG